MGANEKHDATYHGGEHDFGSADPVSANRVRFMSESELDRFIAKIKAEAKAEALRDAADALDSEGVGFQDSWGSNPRDIATVGALMKAREWLRNRANQMKEGK